MTIASYSDLVTAIGNYTHRSDLATRAPEFISLCENRLNYGSEDPQFPTQALRLTAMENRDSNTATNGVITYPTGYLETIRLAIVINGKDRALRYRSAVDLTPFETAQGNAQYYGHVNGSIYVGPVTCPYIHDYFKALTGLSGSNATNWLILNSPNVYLYGCLFEAWTFAGKMEKAANAYRMFAAAVNGLQKYDDKSTMGNSALAVVPG